MQAGARALLQRNGLPGVSSVVPGQSSVDIWYADLVQRAHFKNLIVCGSVWQCPICAAKISERRRVELTTALDKSKALDVALCTFTLHHDRRDKLPDLVDDLLQSHHRLNQGKAWERIKRDYGIVGSIRALEVTHWFNGGIPIYILPSLRAMGLTGKGSAMKCAPAGWCLWKNTAGALMTNTGSTCRVGAATWRGTLQSLDMNRPDHCGRSNTS